MANVSTRTLLLLPLLLVVALGMMLYWGLGGNPQGFAHHDLDRALPRFNAADLYSSQPITDADFKGQITLLNVWASWCSVCGVEKPFLLRLQQLQQTASQSQQNIAIYGLNYRDQHLAAITLLQEKGNPYQKVIFDPQGKLALRLGVYGTPESYLIDQQGRIVYRYSGGLDDEVWSTLFLPRIQALQVKEQQK